MKSSVPYPHMDSFSSNVLTLYTWMMSCYAVGKQGGPSGRGKPPVDLDLGCSTILPGH